MKRLLAALFVATVSAALAAPARAHDGPPTPLPPRPAPQMGEPFGPLVLPTLDGQRVVDCGPFHGLLERSGSRDLAPGEHRVDLYYFQRDGEAKLKVLWTPVGRHDHRPVPARWFQPEKE